MGTQFNLQPGNSDPTSHETWPGKKKETEILNNVIILLKESESRSVDPTL